MPPTLTCGEQFAHAPSRRRAVCAGRLVTRAAAHSASAARKSVRPVCLFAQSRAPAHLRWAIRAPCLWLCPAPHARAAAPGKSRTVFVAAFGPRTHAVGSEWRPTLSFYFPEQTESPPPVPCGREETRRAKAPARPPRTETLEKAELCSFGFFERFPYLPAVCGPKGR